MPTQSEPSATLRTARSATAVSFQLQVAIETGSLAVCIPVRLASP